MSLLPGALFALAFFFLVPVARTSDFACGFAEQSVEAISGSALSVRASNSWRCPLRRAHSNYSRGETY